MFGFFTEMFREGPDFRCLTSGFGAPAQLVASHGPLERIVNVPVDELRPNVLLWSSTNALMAQFVNGGLLYTVAADAPTGTTTTPDDQQLMSRIVGEIQ